MQSIKDELENPYSAYVDYNLVKNEDITPHMRKGISANGTKYYLNKNYNIVKNKRIFDKKKVIYMSKFCVDKESEGVYLDIVSDNKKYIVNFL